MKWSKQKCDSLACETPQWRVSKYLCPRCTIAPGSFCADVVVSVMKVIKLLILNMNTTTGVQSRLVGLCFNRTLPLRHDLTVACWCGHDRHSKKLHNVPWRGDQCCISLNAWMSCRGDGSEAWSQLCQGFENSSSHALWSTGTADSSFDKCPSLKTCICCVHLPSILLNQGSSQSPLGVGTVWTEMFIVTCVFCNVDFHVSRCQSQEVVSASQPSVEPWREWSWQ